LLPDTAYSRVLTYKTHDWNPADTYKTAHFAVQEAGLYKGGKPGFTPQDIVEFIFFPVVNEGCRVVAEGIVDKPADLDVATVLAMGFPPYRRAPCLSHI